MVKTRQATFLLSSTLLFSRVSSLPIDMDPLSTSIPASTSTTLNNSVDLTDTPHDAQRKQSQMRFQARDDVSLLRELAAVESPFVRLRLSNSLFRSAFVVQKLE